MISSYIQTKTRQESKASNLCSPFFRSKYHISNFNSIYEKKADSDADKIVHPKTIDPHQSFFKPSIKIQNVIQKKEDTDAEDTGGNRSKYSEKEIRNATLELERSQLFKDLQTNPQVDSLSKRDYFNNNVKRIEEAIKLEAGGDPTKFDEAEQSVLKFELEFSTYKNESSRELRILSFEEWGGGVAAAKAFDNQNRIELRGKNMMEKSSLQHTLAHEYSHLFDPEANDESIAMAEFKDSRSELFAEIFSQLILCDVSGSTGCSITVLRYGDEEKKLQEETTSGIEAIYSSDVTSKEKSEQINILVKQILSENSESGEPQIP
ncbi:MAG: hypothetical protein IPM38_13075 [Ignavibacteria bacterium]|nr:hypothetical protein [Ignavibacteria bacterium]